MHSGDQKKPLPSPQNHIATESDDTGAGGVFPRNSGGIGSGAAWCGRCWKVGVLEGWFGCWMIWLVLNPQPIAHLLVI